MKPTGKRTVIRLMTFLNPLNGIQTRNGQFLSTNPPPVFWRTNLDNIRDHGGNTNSPSVWYRWTAPANANVSFAVTNNAGSSFDAVLATYTGTSVAGLTLVTNHHGGAQVSSVVFNATSNTTYRIAVAAMNGTRGSFTLAWNQSTAPLFTRHPEATNVVAGETVTFSASVIGVPQPTNQWRLEGTNLPGATTLTYTITNVVSFNYTNQVTTNYPYRFFRAVAQP